MNEHLLETAMQSLTGTTTSQDQPSTKLTLPAPSPEWREKALQLSNLSEQPEPIQKMWLAAENWTRRACRNIKEPFTLLVLCGSVGTGKTTIARNAIGYIADCAMSCVEKGWWRTIPSTHTMRWSAIAETPANERFDVWRDCEQASVLLLDDIGTEGDQFKSGRPVENLRAILEARHGRWTIVTTNIATAHWSDHWDDRITDRLIRNSKVIDVTGARSWALRKMIKGEA